MIYIGKPYNRQIFFDGNSLTNQGASLLVGAQTYPLTTYSSMVSNSYKYAYFNYAIGSRRTATLTSEFPTKFGQYIRKNDIVIMWEITNEAHDFTSDTNGDQLYANVAAYCSQARNYGAKVVILTGIARDMPAFDDANITSRIMACNVQLRNNPSIYDLLIDVGALTQFDQKTDTTNTTYYNTDRTHLTTTGYNLIGDTVYNSLVSSGILS